MKNLKDKAASAAAKVASTAASVAGKIPSPFRKQSPGNPEDEREIQEQGGRWSKIKELELLCALLSHQIYSGSIQEEGFEVLLQDAEPQGWKPGLVILRNFATSSLFVVFRGTADIKDVISDVNIVSMPPYPDRDLGGLQVFGGAWNHLCTRALDEIAPNVKLAIEAGIKNIIFTGLCFSIWVS